MNTRYVIGLDAGTTSFKAALFDERLNMIATRQADYTLITPKPAFVEYKPDDYYARAIELINGLIVNSGIDKNDVSALSISSQGETLICLDVNGNAIGNAIVWTDNRAEREARELSEIFSRKRVYELTGQADITATWPCSKILWLKRNEPERFLKTDKFLLLEDYLVFRLTGARVGEPNLWASSAMLNIHDNLWWQDMLNAIGVSEERLPEIRKCGTVIGQVCTAASDSGLSRNTKIVSGALDQTCNAIGASITRAGEVCETTGACLAVSAITNTFPPFNAESRLTCQNSAIGGRYTVLLWSQSASMTFKWFAREFYKEFTGDLAATFEQMNIDAERVPAGSEGVIMLPHLMGASNPEYDSNATGVFFGFTPSCGRAHFARSIMEAVAYMLRLNIEQLESLDVKPISINCMGGGANSPLWLQIKADATRKIMRRVTVKESACRGAAILALKGVGLRDSIDSDESVQTDAEYQPNAKNAMAYDKGFSDYTMLYSSLKDMFKRRR